MDQTIFLYDLINYLSQIVDGLTQIISRVVKECQHWRSNEFRAILHQRFGIDTLDEYLQTPHSDADIGTEGRQTLPQQIRQFTKYRRNHFLLLERCGTDIIGSSGDRNEVPAMRRKVFFNQRQHHLREELDITRCGFEWGSSAEGGRWFQQLHVDGGPI